MLFSYNWLKEYIKGRLPQPRDLAEVLTLHSFEAEVQGRSSGDWIFDVDILPNRFPDCSSHFGLAREISALLRKELPSKDSIKTKPLEVEDGSLKQIKLKITVPHLVPRYSAVLLEGVKVQDSPRWLKARLAKVGLKPINNIVDITNFVMLELGQPLHAFDYDKIKGGEMTLRESRDRESLITLDGVKRFISEGSLVIEDKEERLIDLAGIMGGRLSAVDSKTKNVFLQSANFDRQTIARTTNKMVFRTRASDIYSHGLDPNLTIFALERAHFLLQESGGGKIVQLIDIYPRKVLPKKIVLNHQKLKSLLGMEISQNEVREILARLGIKSRRQSVFEPPTFRLDINIPEDLIEEVGRLKGWESIPAKLPQGVLILPKRNEKIVFEGMAKDILKGAGFTEVYNYSFTSKRELVNFGYSEKELVRLINPVSKEKEYLRPSLLPALLKNVALNSSRYDEIAIFESGKIFPKEKEVEFISGLIWPGDFFRVKGVVDMILEGLGISSGWYDDVKPLPQDSKLSIWDDFKRAEIKVNGQSLGFLGEINKSLLTRFDIKGVLAAFSLDIGLLSKLATEEIIYRPLPKFPAAVRDIAILVNPGTKVVELLNVINRAGGKLVRDVDLFDIYEGEELPEGKKNIAFHIVYQAEDHTLTSKEINSVHNRIIKAIEKNPEWEVRK